MLKRIMGLTVGLIMGLLVVCVALLGVPTVFSQMDNPQTTYTFVSQFQVPRANWTQYSEDTEKVFVPIAEKLLADGSIVSWSTFENLVHTPEGMTHGAAWSSTSIAGLMRVLDELRKNGPRPGQIAATRHEDLLMQSTMHLGKSGSGTSGYLRVVCQMAKADRPDDYVAAIKKYLWPAFEEQFKSGAASYVGLDQQYVISMAPSMRCVVIMYPNAEGMDKWAAAIGGTLGKLSPTDREALLGSVVPDSRRDYLSRITHYHSK